jgi:hypothetical protein
MKNLTQEELKKNVSYDPETGIFARLIACHGKVKIGDIVNKPDQGYYKISVNSKVYLAHRLAWLYMTGSFPTGSIDHIDGIKTNNKWSNLRDVTRRTNAQNVSTARADNVTGLLGAHYRKEDDRYSSCIQISNGSKIYLGIFDSAEEAHSTYMEAKRKYHEGYARG